MTPTAQPRSQGFSLEGGPSYIQGKSPGNEVVQRPSYPTYT